MNSALASSRSVLELADSAQHEGRSWCLLSEPNLALEARSRCQKKASGFLGSSAEDTTRMQSDGDVVLQGTWSSLPSTALDAGLCPKGRLATWCPVPMH